MLPCAAGHIWLYTAVTDMRKQFDGLAALVQSQLGMRAQLGDWFVFINRRRTQIKILYYHQGSYCLWSKRLEKGTFARADDEGKKQALNSAQLQCLIDGIYWRKDKQNKRLN
jgi:transposase